MPADQDLRRRGAAVTWTQIAWMATTSLVVLWWIWRSRGQHRGGYLLALDHVEMMVRSKESPRTLDETIQKLRDETR